MTDPDSDVLALIHVAHQRAIEQATIVHGREPTMVEVLLLLMQSQIAMLTCTIFDHDELLAYWRNVIAVVREGRDGAPS